MNSEYEELENILRELEELEKAKEYIDKLNSKIKTIHKDIIIKLDDKNNLKNLIVENERDLNFIDEGLIKTIPTRKLIDLFKNFVKNNLDERLYVLKLSDVQDDTNDNRRLTDIILQSDEKQ